MKLGIELKLRKKGLLPEIQLLAEMHFPTKVILPRIPPTLVFSATKKTAVSVSNLIPSIDRGNTTRSKRMNLIGACDLCLERDQLPDQ